MKTFFSEDRKTKYVVSEPLYVMYFYFRSYNTEVPKTNLGMALMWTLTEVDTVALASWASSLSELLKLIYVLLLSCSLILKAASQP